MFFKALGKSPSGALLKKIQASPNYRDGMFWNVEPTSVNPGGLFYFKMLYDFLTAPSTRIPKEPVATEKSNLHELTGDDTPQLVWFGHSSYLIVSKGYRVLVDPVLFGNASPVSFAGGAFAGATIYEPADIPMIDLLIITHDHYDHLDCVTLGILKDRIRHVVCGLGVSSHLISWGFDAARITELDWNTSAQITAQCSVTALPARHFSGRSIHRYNTLWCSYSLSLGPYKVFIGGDSGYDAQFAKTGSEHGPFDLACLECGQYNRSWPEIHMFPEQTALAAKDLQAKVLMPVHWGKFSMSIHPWTEPIERLLKAVPGMPYKTLVPVIGKTLILEAKR